MIIIVLKVGHRPGAETTNQTKTVSKEGSL